MAPRTRSPSAAPATAAPTDEDLSSPQQPTIPTSNQSAVAAEAETAEPAAIDFIMGAERVQFLRETSEPLGLLARVHPLTPLTLPEDPSRNMKEEPNANPPVIAFQKLIGYGREVDDLPGSYYYASVLHDGKLIPGLVVKYLDMDYIAPRSWAREQLAHECHAFDLARSLQGIHIPRFAGLFQHGDDYCLVYDDAGRGLAKPPPAEESAELFEALYSVGVSPRDNECFWLRRGLDGRLKMATFYESQSEATVEPLDLERTGYKTPEEYIRLGGEVTLKTLRKRELSFRAFI